MCHNTHIGAGESDLQQLNLQIALHVILDSRSHLDPGFIQLLEDLQILEGLVHLQQTQLVVSLDGCIYFIVPIVVLQQVQQQNTF